MGFWENKIYGKGLHLNKYPFDAVVSFIFRYSDNNTNKRELKILELGCGAGNNLAFAQKEGYRVMGVDISKSAIEHCRHIFKQEGLDGEFILADFMDLNLEPKSVDFVIDRASIGCCSIENQKKIIEKVFYTLKPNGFFLFTPYSQNHQSYDESLSVKDGFMLNVKKGPLKGLEGINFNNKKSLDKIIDKEKWGVLEFKEIVSYENIDERVLVSAQ